MKYIKNVLCEKIPINLDRKITVEKTLNELLEKIGISRSIMSKVFSDKGYVAPETKES